MTDLSPWAALAAGAAATYLPRLLGVALSGGIDPDGRLFRWVGCVAYALLAGLIARMILLPVGPLQEVDLANRLASVALALAAYWGTRGNLVLGVAAGVLALVGLTVGGVRLL